MTPQTVERFISRFGDQVSILHSKLSIGERYDQWQRIINGKANVVVGVRSAIFAPLNNLGIIIIDEEHETSYKSESVPKYNAKQIAYIRAKYNNAVLIYGSATPSIENYYRSTINEIKLLEMNKRTNFSILPSIKLVDMRNANERNENILSTSLIEEINKNIQNNEQTILLLNRRGYSSFLLCSECGYVIKCLNCSVTLTYHSSTDRLVCHHCGYTIKKPLVCPSCKNDKLFPEGVGTQRIEEELKEIFPNANVLRMDADTTIKKGSHKDILDSFKRKNIDILIGTQMVAKGHDFPNVTLVGILSADSVLNTPDFRAGERAFQLFTQAAGRAGRGDKKGRVLIQAYNIDDYSLTTSVNQDYNTFYKNEIMIRKNLNYPPFVSIGEVTLVGMDNNITRAQAEIIKSYINTKLHNKGELIGPVRPVINRLKNKYRWRIIIKCKNKKIIHLILQDLIDKYSSSLRKKNILLNIDINPNSLL